MSLMPAVRAVHSAVNGVGCIDTSPYKRSAVLGTWSLRG